MYYLDRSAVILKHKKPFIDWINSVQPESPLDEEFINSQCTVLLIPVYDTEADAIASIEKNYKTIFKKELANWYTSEEWPKGITLEKFRDWIEISCYNVVVDMLKKEITKEPY